MSYTRTSGCVLTTAVDGAHSSESWRLLPNHGFVPFCYVDEWVEGQELPGMRVGEL